MPVTPQMQMKIDATTGMPPWWHSRPGVKFIFLHKKAGDFPTRRGGGIVGQTPAEKLGPVRGLDRIRYRKGRLSRTSAVSICTFVLVKQVN